MSLRRGFKTEANSYAREFREELGLSAYEPLCPWKLAAHLAIPIITLSSLRPVAPKSVAYLLGAGRSYFSAVTIAIKRRRVIMHNDGNPKTRQASDLSHEIAHAVLGHKTGILFNELGTRVIDREAEEEAKWLGPALLISDEAALHIARERMAIPDAARFYRVSPDIVRMRLNVTAALRRAG